MHYVKYKNGKYYVLFGVLSPSVCGIYEHQNEAQGMADILNLQIKIDQCSEKQKPPLKFEVCIYLIWALVFFLVFGYLV